MTSGEWDLRALKALEEEEQKEFLALSQKSLFEPPSPPPQAKQLNAQHLIHSALTERERSQQATVPTATTCNSTNYIQLQAQQLLKLPTINEHYSHQYQLKNKAKSSEGGGGRLKFTKVLSLSAHSLTNRLSGGSAAGSRSAKKSSRSNSPSHYGSPSPLYTPPPTRRCNTLHHSQPQARKAFKTLQQIEKQKQERKQESLSRNRTLQRIAGTNKTYWKYGIHSTANSITQQHQQNLKHRKSLTTELESNTSDEVGSEEMQPIDSVHLSEEENHKYSFKEKADKSFNPAAQADCEDVTTETGSCSVPLAMDSIEMMSLMLNAATSAVKTQPSCFKANDRNSNPPPPDIAATSVGILDNSINDFPKYFTLNHHNLSGLNGVIENANEETVAYETFHNMLSRRKSFSGEKLLRAQSLQRNSSLQHDNHEKQQKPLKQQTRYVNNRLLLKSSSFDAPISSLLEYNGSENSKTINHLVTNNNKSSNKPTSLKTNKSSSLSNKKFSNPLPYNNSTTDDLHAEQQQNCNQICSSEFQRYLQQHQLHIQQQHLLNRAYHAQHLQHLQAQHFHNLLDSSGLNTSSLIIDDELEAHIKQCSCSCNHMGYGNSMDYQVSLLY